MATDKTLCCDVLKDYPRAIVHLRHQVEEKRFGLVLGAGVASDFKIPQWKTLVAKLAASEEVDGKELLEGEVKEKSLPYKTEMLFQRFRDRTLKDITEESDLAKHSKITDKWLSLFAKYLYADVDPDFSKSLNEHPYFSSILPLVNQSHLTVNFNFDDFLERSIEIRKRPEDKTRGYEVVTDPWPQFRRKAGVIYHPHGIVPDQTRRMELPTDRFVFSEAAYSAQYVGSRGHDTSFLLSHFARNTCLILGCSLEDELRNVLMRGAQINPGNYHYYVYYVGEGNSGLSEEQRTLIAETNFNVYNLITLFLTSKKIKALLDVINKDATPEQDFKDLGARAEANLKYIYYLTGALGVGKSTTTAQLRSLQVLDEWLEARPSVLAIPWEDLSDDERKNADNWIANQFHEKNNRLRNFDYCISSVDRPPLDPLVFTKEMDRPKKATTLLDAICPDRKWNIEPGVVILLMGDEEVLSARVRTTGREKYTPEKIKEMQEDLRKVYLGAEKVKGVHVIDTRHLSVLEVTKKVSEIIHRKPYETFDLMGSLLKYEGKMA
ncbi:MAG: SIR2 family protein [Nitrosomonadales bacterium]|nr:SIR2 family protein [Nitrosomonadales bacterium]